MNDTPRKSNKLSPWSVLAFLAPTILIMLCMLIIFGYALAHGGGTFLLLAFGTMLLVAVGLWWAYLKSGQLTRRILLVLPWLLLLVPTAMFFLPPLYAGIIAKNFLARVSDIQVQYSSHPNPSPGVFGKLTVKYTALENLATEMPDFDDYTHGSIKAHQPRISLPTVDMVSPINVLAGNEKLSIDGVDVSKDMYSRLLHRKGVYVVTYDVGLRAVEPVRDANQQTVHPIQYCLNVKDYKHFLDLLKNTSFANDTEFNTPWTVYINTHYRVARRLSGGYVDHGGFNLTMTKADIMSLTQDHLEKYKLPPCKSFQ